MINCKKCMNVQNIYKNIVDDGICYIAISSFTDNDECC